MEKGVLVSSSKERSWPLSMHSHWKLEEKDTDAKRSKGRKKESNKERKTERKNRAKNQRTFGADDQMI